MLLKSRLATTLRLALLPMFLRGLLPSLFFNVLPPYFLSYNWSILLSNKSKSAILPSAVSLYFLDVDAPYFTRHSLIAFFYMQLSLFVLAVDIAYWGIVIPEFRVDLSLIDAISFLPRLKRTGFCYSMILRLGLAKCVILYFQ
jgi:hypothetical protein